MGPSEIFVVCTALLMVISILLTPSRAFSVLELGTSRSHHRSMRLWALEKDSAVVESLKEIEPATDDRSHRSVKEIVVSTSMEMPFAAAAAFDAFSDLPRQASFSPWLQSVEYLTPPAQDEDRIGRHLGETKWTMNYMGFSFSWNAISTRLERPHVIEWKSTSGMQNFGKVDFQPLESGGTDMKMTMTFVAPRFVAALFRRSNKMAAFVENKMLVATLVNFRDAVMKEDLEEL